MNKGSKRNEPKNDEKVVKVTFNKSSGKKKNVKFSELALSKYFSDVVAEMKKVSWPSWTQIRNGVMVVMTMLVIVGSIVSLLDLGFSYSMKSLMSLRK